MVEMPKRFNGRPVLQSVQFATDNSQLPYHGTIVLQYANNVCTVLDIFSGDGETWSAENGRHRVSTGKAAEILAERCEHRDRFKEIFQSREVRWVDIAIFRWDDIPVSGREEFTLYARSVAGNARKLPDFYALENRGVQAAIERWLSRYSAEHTHESLRS